MKELIIHPIVWEHYVGFWRFSKGSLRSQWSREKGLELMASTLGSTFQKEEVGVRLPLWLASSPLQVLLMKAFVY